MKKHKEGMLYENLEKMRGAAYRYEATIGRCYETAKKTGLLCMKMHIIIAGNLYKSLKKTDNISEDKGKNERW